MLYVGQMTTKWTGSSRGLPDCEGGRGTDHCRSRWRETAREPVGLESDPAMVDGMREEERRLMTYENWPSSSQDPAKLAEVGLFYTGRLDRVKCAFCLGVLKEWQPGDIPLAEHRRHFPYCRFIRGEDVGNIPARQSTIHRIPGTSGLRPATRDASVWIKGCGTSDVNESMYITPSRGPPNYRLRPSDTEASPQRSSDTEGYPKRSSDTKAYPKRSLDTEAYPKRSSDTVTYHKPSSTTLLNYSTDKTVAQSVDTADGTLDYTSEASRLATFKHWPVEAQILPEVLARAGFYHAPTPGKPDRVRCGYCQGKLYAWSGEEDPEMEHKKCFPTCPFAGMAGGEARRTNHSLTSSSISSFCEGNRATSVPERLNLPSKNALSTASGDMATTNQAEFCERMRGEEGVLPKQNMKDIGGVMLSDTVARVVEMGFARETIEKVVMSKSSSGELSTVQGLVEAVLNYDV
ncbi:baculoviral IAP repeat-containing protein 2-like [Haliotis rubra]|uniref:baculoviral IAP repeat-containing protein 2-like n=1 Tax=Haliotis rubra TaxID=36100 RepID=UPI001EE508BB|nr:baculoviral IAP repeat-containing protein 2-like [Haliotis rubra]